MQFVCRRRRRESPPRGNVEKSIATREKRALRRKRPIRLFTPVKMDAAVWGIKRGGSLCVCVFGSCFCVCLFARPLRVCGSLRSSAMTGSFILRLWPLDFFFKKKKKH